jgi:hypothetical protein
VDTVCHVIGWGKVILHNLPSFQEVSVEDTSSTRKPAIKFYTLSYHEMQKPYPSGEGFYVRYGEWNRE